jgi:hypothetical protein
MGIRYSGVVRQVTADLATALEDLKNHRGPQSVPPRVGEVSVRPGDAVTPPAGGTCD